MAERPILFSSPMVRAILDGRKTQTRRVVKTNENPGDWHTFSRCDSDGSWIAWGSPAAHGSQQQYDEFTQKAYPVGGGIRCPYGVPGDRLWVRETWVEVMHVSPATDDIVDLSPGDRVIEPATRGAWAKPGEVGWKTWDSKGRVVCYRATSDMEFCDGDGFSGEMRDKDDCPRWRPSIHMPRWASRLTLEVVSIRVERLNEISEEDAKDEGYYGEGVSRHESEARNWFAGLWDSINAKRHPWASNPWVWVVEFKRLEATDAR